MGWDRPDALGNDPHDHPNKRHPYSIRRCHDSGFAYGLLCVDMGGGNRAEAGIRE